MTEHVLIFINQPPASSSQTLSFFGDCLRQILLYNVVYQRTKVRWAKHVFICSVWYKEGNHWLPPHTVQCFFYRYSGNMFVSQVLLMVFSDTWTVWLLWRIGHWSVSWYSMYGVLRVPCHCYSYVYSDLVVPWYLFIECAMGHVILIGMCMEPPLMPW